MIRALQGAAPAGAFGPAFTRWAQSTGARLAVTGATGWMGRAVAEMAFAAGLTPANGRLRVFGSTARSGRVGGEPVRIEALNAASPLGGGEWLLLHFAFLGKEKTEDREADAFMADNAAILRQALALADSAQAVRLVFASSGAVYGPGRRLVAAQAESPYGWAKVLHEQACAEWAARSGAPLVVPRIFNIGGPCINKLDRYALSSLIALAQGRGPMKVAARRPTFRSFVHVEEMLAVIADAAVAAAPGQCAGFDTCGREIVEMGDLARAVADQVRPGASIERDWDQAGTADWRQADWYVGEAREYHLRAAALGRPMASLSRIIDDTVASLRAAEQPEPSPAPH